MWVHLAKAAVVLNEFAAVRPAELALDPPILPLVAAIRAALPCRGAGGMTDAWPLLPA